MHRDGWVRTLPGDIFRVFFMSVCWRLYVDGCVLGFLFVQGVTEGGPEGVIDGVALRASFMAVIMAFEQRA